MKIGDAVRLTGLPDGLPEETESVFQRCLGHSLVIAGFNEIGWAEIDVGSITGLVCETIWVEPQFLVPICG
jgi:hypothetical protein